METEWQKYDGGNWVDCTVGDTIEENGQYRIATTIIVDDEDFEQYTPAALISLTIDGKILAIPRDASNLIFYVNTDLVQGLTNNLSLNDILMISLRESFWTIK